MSKSVIFAGAFFAIQVLCSPRARPLPSALALYPTRSPYTLYACHARPLTNLMPNALLRSREELLAYLCHAHMEKANVGFIGIDDFDSYWPRVSHWWQAEAFFSFFLVDRFASAMLRSRRCCTLVAASRWRAVR